MGYLILTRRIEESVVIGEEDYILTVDRIYRDQVSYTVETREGVTQYDDCTENSMVELMDGKIRIFVSAISGNQAKFAFECPREISIHRSEIYQRILDEREGMREVARG